MSRLGPKSVIPLVPAESDSEEEEVEESDEEEEVEEEEEEDSEEDVVVSAALVTQIPVAKLVASAPQSPPSPSPVAISLKPSSIAPKEIIHYSRSSQNPKEQVEEEDEEEEDDEEEEEDDSEEDEDVEGNEVKKVENEEKNHHVETFVNERIADTDDMGDSSSHKPIQIIKFRDDHQFELDEEALESILLQDHVKDRHIVVVSVAGAFRKGKSFILDFFLRYMHARYKNHDVGSEWLGSEDMPLDGFSWRGGCERDTTGILLWSDVFLADLPSGEKVGVILMDTQGAFDSESTVRDCATVFALSTMISSLQIYNLSHNIQEDDLQHLQLFTEYGRLALEQVGEKPFQRLQFLVRDWSFPYEAPYGSEGGERILARRLQVSDKQHPELQSLRRHIKSCFTDISCFLMPHPGLRVATSQEFDGRLAEIESEFKKCLAQLVPLLLAPENLVLKQISGQKVKGKELLQYFKSYINMYKGNDLPEPKSMLMATAEANNLAAVAAAKESYTQAMEQVCGGTRPYLNSEHLESEHNRVRDKAVFHFATKKKMGGEEFSEVYRQQLETDIEEMFQQFKSYNESKNIFKAAKTPAVFFAVAVIFYVLSGVLGLFGMYALANICNIMMGLALVTLITWAYIRYSGEMVDIGHQLDEVALLLWEGLLKPVYRRLVEKSLEQAAFNAAASAVAATASGNSTSTASGSSSINGRLKSS